jgi:hypothetical protein
MADHCIQAGPKDQISWMSVETSFLLGVSLLPVLRLAVVLVWRAYRAVQDRSPRGQMDVFYAVDQPARLLLNLDLRPANRWMNFGYWSAPGLLTQRREVQGGGGQLLPWPGDCLGIYPAHH